MQSPQPVPLIDYAGLEASHRELLEQLVVGHTTLDRVLAWAGPARVVRIVTQDEYAHDVIVRAEPSVYLAYDTT